ncbi:putative tRNA (adenine(37)-N6)-methyltransferase [bacterium BMS3Abin05]|nr:putative tRNA (adenine(37)-N6)-methyltransferase [bacterium BMS3Abin05]GBE26107.1 putative tRNA (adenine(37)-N6)-methyltransferase [bacterium BMS3Bbin03]
MEEITFTSIGRVRCEFREPRELEFACELGLKCSAVSEIILDPEFKTGLEGLQHFSHAFVLFHIHKVAKTELKTYPAPLSIKHLQPVGVFASRSQYRPNPIGLRLVKILQVSKNRLVVEGLDAIDGTPVLDIKPYVPGFDRPAKVNTAVWYHWQNGQD